MPGDVTVERIVIIILENGHSALNALIAIIISGNEHSAECLIIVAL